MSLKSIEMQVAIPRTLDATKLHEQLQQQSQLMVDHANEAVQKDVEKKRNHVIKNDRSAQTKLQHHKHNQENRKHEQPAKDTKENAQNKEHHPYKGTIIDYSG